MLGLSDKDASRHRGKCTRYKSWFGTTWQQRVELVARAYEATIKGVPSTRITESERAFLLKPLAEVRRDALDRPPGQACWGGFNPVPIHA